MYTIKTVLPILLIIILSFCQGSAQGELVNLNQSGGAFLFETSKVEKLRAYAIGYSYIHKRKFEAGLSAFKTSGGRYYNTKENKGLGLHASGFLNSESWIHMKGTFGVSFGSGNTITTLSSTIFASNSKSASKLIPSVSLILVGGEFAYSGGLHFKLGTGFNLIGGISATKYKNQDLIFGLSIGFLFVESASAPKE